ncbi:putative Phosphoseryl-tRNA Kinase [Trypanosoma cruzi]|uniref:L-seryl-tRNA(Sec) kinase n=1 Tax=Trypanosoma cruzi TaxID=5693 RepID=A0A7J6YI23_TRYCR|nr:hypothetical protein ECC02_000538 [Trypanosoma cruzi]KAF8291513.1 putative Phosphoseryl-tRNA Kinase [Trypanosoma cruzi]
MRICLVLLSGLPGAGKTTLSLAIQRLSEQVTTEGERSNSRHGGVVEAVLELDTFISSYEERDRTQRNGSNFSPEAWRRACDEVREATFQRLRQCLLNPEKKRGRNMSSTTTRFVFLVDTLPYRSMRASYWKLCRDLGKEQFQHNLERDEVMNKCDGRVPLDAVFVNMVEIRLNTPIEICLERNERRSETPQYIPPHVIKSMGDSFDVGVDTSAKFSADDNCWVVSPRQASTPWPVIWLEDVETNCCLPPAALAQKLLERLHSSELMGELEKQSASFFEAEVKRRERERCDHDQPQEGDAAKASRSDWLHQVDLRLRAVVQQYMKEFKKSGKLLPGTGALVSKCREEQYAQVKAMLACRQDDEAFDARKETLLHDLLLEFERRLLAL